MNILIISLTPLAYTGITNVIFNYLRYMDKLNMNITVLSTRGAMDWCVDELKTMNINFIELTRNKKPISYLRKLYKLIKVEKIDIVHSHGNSNTIGIELAVARLARVKTRIAHVHSTSCTHKVLSFLLRPLFIFGYTHGLACSHDAGIYLFKKRKFTIINNAFYVKKFGFNEEYRMKHRNDLGLNSMTVVGNIGLFNKGKNQEFLVDVFVEYQKLNKNSILVFIGTGKTENQVRKRTILLGIENSVLFLGNRNDVNELLSAFDYFVFPSLYEGLGIVLLETQANGLPIIASDKVIPNQVKVSDNFLFLSLDNRPEIWAKSISCMSKSRNIDGLNNVEKAGYNILVEARNMRNLYIRA